MSLLKTPGEFREEPEDSEQEEAFIMSFQLLQEDQNLTLSIEGILFVKDVVEGIGARATRDIDPNNVESLACTGPENWPPISVTKTTLGYVCYDGRHRIEAAKSLGFRIIKAVCKTLEDVNQLVDEAFRANLRHGLQASIETKSDYCYWLHLTFPELTHRQIASRVGVSQSTVSRAIEYRVKQLQVIPLNTLQGANQDDDKEDPPDELEQWKQGLVKRARTLVKIAGKYSHTVKGRSEDYTKLVYELQLELLRAPEDRELLLFAGHLFLDAANKRVARRGRVSQITPI